jgi:hypothetical protein
MQSTRNQKKSPQRSTKRSGISKKGKNPDLKERFDQLAALEAPKSTGPLLYKQTEGGTLEQVGREADNAWAGVKRIMALLNVEGKAYDIQSSFTATYAGTVFSLSGVTQGVGDNQRTGDSCKLTRLRVHMKAVYASGNVLCQLVIGRSKDALPAIADVFDTLGTGYAGCSFENHDQRKADTWLVHRTFIVDATKPTIHLELELNKLDVDTLFANATATGTSGTYWMAFVCDNVSGPTITLMSRADFVDN